MLYTSDMMEQQAVLQTAAAMCAAARTAPKGVGKDFIETMVVTGEEKEQLVQTMIAIGKREFGEKWDQWYGRDAANVDAAQAVVLIGGIPSYRGIRKCGFCGFEHCAACEAAGGMCAFLYIDLGIALGSAAAIAADARVDNRMMLSVGKAAMELGWGKPGVLWQGIPLSVKGKNVFFDRVIKK